MKEGCSGRDYAVYSKFANYNPSGVVEVSIIPLEHHKSP